MPYSLSRWTDVPAGKWPWLMESLRRGYMDAFDPGTGFPGRWSLKPEDTLGLVFWTKDPRNILTAQETLNNYKVQVHVTMTDWHEVEIGAPRPVEDKIWAHTSLLRQFLPPESVIWRFSPVPLVSDVVERFERIADRMSGSGFRRVFLSFLQENDKIPETRSAAERIQIMRDLAAVGAAYKIDVRLCNEDRTLLGVQGLPTSLASGVCAPPEDWALPGLAKPPSEGCGCTLMVDPFTINESCTMGCQYCYASDKTIAVKKRNTTRRLPVVG